MGLSRVGRQENMRGLDREEVHQGDMRKTGQGTLGLGHTQCGARGWPASGQALQRPYSRPSAFILHEHDAPPNPPFQERKRKKRLETGSRISTQPGTLLHCGDDSTPNLTSNVRSKDGLVEPLLFYTLQNLG